MVTLAETKTEFNNWISEDATVSFLEKAQAGKTTLEDIADALDEFKRLHEAGLASPAEIITLARAYPSNKTYTEAADGLDEDETNKPMVVGGPASVELVDREGHLITTMALKKAFKKFMKNFRARNVMVMHSDVQVGHALPAYISKSGNIFKSGVDENGLFFISELRGDTKISKRVRDQIEKGGMSSYSIAGSATKSKDIKKSDGSNVLQVDDMELAEVTICEKGVNQGAHFELLKGDKASGSCVDGSCLTNHSEPAPSIQTEYIAISKEDINHIDMFNNWISKAPMMAGAAGKMPKAITPPKPANVTGNIGMPVKMSMEKRKEKINPFAIATAMAKKKGFKNFSDDSKGDKYRDKITEGIKETYNMKKEFLSKRGHKESKISRERKSAILGTGGTIQTPVRQLRDEKYAQKIGGALSRLGMGRSGAGRGTRTAQKRAQDLVLRDRKKTEKKKLINLSKQEPKKQKGIAGAVASGVKSLGVPTKRIKRGSAAEEAAAKTGGKILSRAGLGRSGRGRGTIGATKRALGAISRSAPRRALGGIGAARKRKFADLRRSPSGRPAGPKVKPAKERNPMDRPGAPSLKSPKTSTKRTLPGSSRPSRGTKRTLPGSSRPRGSMQNLLARRGQQGTPSRLGDIPKGKPQKLTAPKSVTKGDIMDNVSNIVKQVFKSQVWDIVNERWVSKDVLPPVKRPTRQPKLTDDQKKIRSLERRLAAQEGKETPEQELKRRMAEGREASAKKKERDARAKAQRQLLARLNAPQPSQADLEGPAAERERLAESAAARKRKFTPPKPVGTDTPRRGTGQQRVSPRDFESERQAARKNLSRMQADYARTKERAGKGQTLATRYDPTSPAGSGSRPSAPKAPKTTTEVSVPKKVAGSGREEQQMRRTGTTRPSAPAPKKEPTAMQRAASFRGKGTVKPSKTSGGKPTAGTTTTKLSGTKPSAPKARAPRPGSAAASLAANRREIARRQAARKLASGGATRQTEQG